MLDCPICATVMVEFHCEAFCRGCGYRMDCSDG